MVRLLGWPGRHASREERHRGNDAKRQQLQQQGRRASVGSCTHGSTRLPSVSLSDGVYHIENVGRAGAAIDKLATWRYLATLTKDRWSVCTQGRSLSHRAMAFTLVLATLVLPCFCMCFRGLPSGRRRKP